jgi:hypothetical protein
VGNNGTKSHAKTGMAGGAAVETWLWSGVVSEDELGCDEDELPPLPGELVEAVDELFEELEDLHRLEDAVVRELLWRVLERVCRLEHFCLGEAGMFGWTVEDARDSEEREWLLGQERNFVGYCRRELDSIARAAIEFTVALWIQCSPDWEESSQSVSEARSELVSELQIAAAPPGRWFALEATKRDVADSMKGTLWRAASEVACAAHELADARLPGMAGSTMIGAAASLMFVAFEIEQAIARQAPAGP